MAPPKTHTMNSLKLPIAVVLIFFLSPRPVLLVAADGLSLHPSQSGTLHKWKQLLGSRPPGCVNKCLNCRPCTATLVVPSQQGKVKGFTSKTSTNEDDGMYYLLSWKCRCGDKIFQP